MAGYNPFTDQVQGVRAGQSIKRGGGYGTGAADDFADVDQYRIANLQEYLRGGDKGLARHFAGAANPETARAAINAAQARSNLRQGLIKGVEDIPGLYDQEGSLLKSEADQALKSGLSTTRKNYNRRGLLYSGLREGGERNMRSDVAGALASGMAGSAKDYQNLLDKRKEALASIELANAKQAQDNANEAFELSLRNQVARAQALQQLGSGVGYGLAYAYKANQNDNSIPNTSPA